MAIRGQLHPIGEPVCNVLDEVLRRAQIACAHEPAKKQLGVRGHRGPCPDITPPFPFALGAQVLLFAAAEGPYLVALDALEREIPKRLVLVARASLTHPDQEPGNCVLGHSAETGSGAHAVPFAKAGNDLRAFFWIQLVHIAEYGISVRIGQYLISPKVA